MLRRLLTLTLALGWWGCGDEARVSELKTYVNHLQKLRPFTERVETYITRFDDPSIEVAQQDVGAARALLDEYAAAVEAVPLPYEATLKNVHQLYLRSFGDARRLARDETGDLRRQAHSVAIGFRNLRRDVAVRVYQSIDVLLGRENLEGGEYELVWPDRG